MRKPKLDKEPVTKAQANNQIKSMVERIENLEAEKKEIQKGISEVYLEAKGNGYDVSALREIIRIRKMDADKRAEREATVDLYREALGMLSDLPLGQAALERAATH